MCRESALNPLRRRLIRRQLLNWYGRHRRDLPWRRRQGDGYAQLVAEVMLQQTQVSTAIAYYQRFLERFPTVAALAAADRDEILALWSGLGYYRRAQYLHAAARKIIAEHDGVVPARVEDLMTLPGVGRYTAGAIASIAYGVRAPVVDGNAARVLMRLLALEADPRLPAVQARLWAEAESLLPARRCGEFNQALMELGSTICLPRGPRCPTCPLRTGCRARCAGSTDRIPPPRKRVRVMRETQVVAAVRRPPRLLFVQRPADGLWAGLWELPAEPVRPGESLVTALRRLRRQLPAGCRLSSRSLGTVTRHLTHRSITFCVHEGWLPAGTRITSIHGRPARWLRACDLSHVGLSRACEAILKLLDQSAKRDRPS